MVNIAIIYYSATGHTYQVAQAAEAGARAAGAQTRLRKVHEIISAEAIAQNPGMSKYQADSQQIPEATLDDLDWANGYLFGTPTRFGAMSAQLKIFLDSAGQLWQQGRLANKAVAAFTGAANDHGGQESTLLTIYNVMYHWGAIIIPNGYTDTLLYASGGNPYGVSFTATRHNGALPPEILNSAHYMGERVTRYAYVISSNISRLAPLPQKV